MMIDVKIKMNSHLFVKDPEQSELGRKIVTKGLELINSIGFEEFTFKKLAKSINTTEASIYRYFENKHRLLTYLISWYWSFLEFKIIYHTNNIKNPKDKLIKVLEILAKPENTKHQSDYLSEKDIYQLLVYEGAKSYLTRHVTVDNRELHFKPLKSLTKCISDFILEFKPKFKYANSLASTLIETTYSQKFFMNNLTTLTSFRDKKDLNGLFHYLELLLFNCLK
ncbi:MAG: TetR/AcrR family transcriptional regulator [Sphingobacteriaceae bacterium]|nr:TetR/AcrR family transcriptional regulator [Sphingobacteriaceae bacterium]